MAAACKGCINLAFVAASPGGLGGCPKEFSTGYQDKDRSEAEGIPSPPVALVARAPGGPPCLPFSLAFPRAGNSRAAKMAMMAITTRSSMSVNARLNSAFILLLQLLILHPSCRRVSG